MLKLLPLRQQHNRGVWGIEAESSEIIMNLSAQHNGTHSFHNLRLFELGGSSRNQTAGPGARCTELFHAHQLLRTKLQVSRVLIDPLLFVARACGDELEKSEVSDKILVRP
jgi:hypothetical protein